MRKVILILLVFISAKVNAQVYQEMPQYGYRANRMAFDSTLQIPTTCGVPTLRSNVTKKSAIAFDSCNNKLYRYNPSNFTWAEVSGGTGLTYNLQRVLDSGAIAYNRNLTLIDSGNGYANRSTIAFDLQRFGADNYMTINDNAGYRIAKYSNQYARISSLASGGGNGKSIQIGWENTSDNFMSLSFAKSDFTYPHKLKSGSTFANAYTTTIPAVTGTLAMSVNNQTADANGNITITSTLDTTNQFVKRLTRTEGKDSIIYFVGANRFAIKDSVGGGGVPYTGATQDVDLGAFKISAQSFQVEGTNGLGHIHFKHQNSDATATGQSTVLYANSNGDLKYKNAGNYYSTLKTQQSADRVYTFQNKSYTLADSSDLSAKLNANDTTVFQRKSIPSYTFIANNTSATANGTAQFFKDTSGTYTGTIAWNGTAPTGGNLTYRWTRIGKMVNINISLIYSTQGSSNSTLTVTLPSDAPTPSKPAGLTSALNQLYPIVGSVNITNSSTLTNSGTRGFLRNNTANNGFEFILNYTASTAANAYITCTYFTD